MARQRVIYLAGRMVGNKLRIVESCEDSCRKSMSCQNAPSHQLPLLSTEGLSVQVQDEKQTTIVATLCKTSFRTCAFSHRRKQITDCHVFACFHRKWQRRFVQARLTDQVLRQKRISLEGASNRRFLQSAPKQKSYHWASDEKNESKSFKLPNCLFLGSKVKGKASSVFSPFKCCLLNLYQFYWYGRKCGLHFRVYTKAKLPILEIAWYVIQRAALK